MHCRVRSPVAIVTTVQRTFRSVNRQIHIYIAPNAEQDLFLSRYMPRTIAYYPKVGLKKLLIPFEYLIEINGSGFLFTFKKEFDINIWFERTSDDSLIRGNDREHAGFIIGGSTTI